MTRRLVAHTPVAFLSKWLRRGRLIGLPGLLRVVTSLMIVRAVARDLASGAGGGGR